MELVLSDGSGHGGPEGDEGIRASCDGDVELSLAQRSCLFQEVTMTTVVVLDDNNCSEPSGFRMSGEYPSH